MKLITGKVKGRTYALTIKAAKERGLRDPLTNELLPLSFHEARIITAFDGGEVDDTFAREYRVWEGEDGLTDEVVNFIKSDMLKRARTHIYC